MATEWDPSGDWKPSVENAAGPSNGVVALSGPAAGERRKKISIITSAYNEGECIDELARRLSAVFDSLPTYDFEAIIVENGSEDDTFDRLNDIAMRDNRFKIMQLARNFRMDGGLTAGLSAVDADAVVLMAADLQDPPEMIPAFVMRWEAGYENVYGVVTSRRGTGIIRTMNSRLFYWGIGKMTGHLIPANASDFRLLDRRVYEQVRSMEERNRFVRGLVAWVGFRSIGVEHEREERYAGASKAHSIAVMQLASKAVLAHSQVPLAVIPVIGLGLIAASVLSLAGLLIDWAIQGGATPTAGIVACLVVAMFGLLFSCLGVVGLYVGQIYEEVKGRPNFVVRQTLGFEAPREPDVAPPVPIRPVVEGSRFSDHATDALLSSPTMSSQTPKMITKRPIQIPDTAPVPDSTPATTRTGP